MLHARPASCKVKAAFSPAIPAPMIAMRVCLSIFLLYDSQGLSILSYENSQLMLHKCDNHQVVDDCHTYLARCYKYLIQALSLCSPLEQASRRHALSRGGPRPWPCRQHHLLL